MLVSISASNFLDSGNIKIDFRYTITKGDLLNEQQTGLSATIEGITPYKSLYKAFTFLQDMEVDDHVLYNHNIRLFLHFVANLRKIGGDEKDTKDYLETIFANQRDSMCFIVIKFIHNNILYQYTTKITSKGFIDQYLHQTSSDSKSTLLDKKQEMSFNSLFSKPSHSKLLVFNIYSSFTIDKSDKTGFFRDNGDIISQIRSVCSTQRGRDYITSFLLYNKIQISDMSFLTAGSGVQDIIINASANTVEQSKSLYSYSDEFIHKFMILCTIAVSKRNPMITSAIIPDIDGNMEASNVKRLFNTICDTKSYGTVQLISTFESNIIYDRIQSEIPGLTSVKVRPSY